MSPDPRSHEFIRNPECVGWTEVFAGIESGEERWLLVARALRPISDGGMGVNLDTVVLKALQSNPSGVEMLLKSSYEVDKVCELPYGDVTEFELKAYLGNTIPALEKYIKETDSAVMRHCLDNLRSQMLLREHE